MGKLNNEFKNHVDYVLRVLVQNANESNIDLNEDLLQHVRKTMLQDNYTLYATGNYGGPSLPKDGIETVVKTKSKKKGRGGAKKYQWKYHTDDKNYSLTKDIEENVTYIRLNSQEKIIGTIDKDGVSKLTDEQIELLVRLGLEYDNTLLSDE
jgi:hypothetical protein